MKKKQPRKVKQRPDRTQLFLDHLQQYDDPLNLDLGAFPLVLPHKFSLALGHRPVGKVVMDWHALWAKIFDVAADMAKPDDMSDDEYTEQLKVDFREMDPKDRGRIVNTISAVVVYMMEHLPEKLNDAILQLSIESRHNMIILEQRRLGSQDIPSPAELANFVGKMEREATKRRLPEVRGGDKKTKPEWRGPETKKRYAERVNHRRPLTRCIKDIFDDWDSDAGWIEDLRQNPTFQQLSSGVSEKILRWAIRRIASENMTGREREPLSVALEMTRQELGLPEVELETLHGYYTEGTKLLKKARK